MRKLIILALLCISFINISAKDIVPLPQQFVLKINQIEASGKKVNVPSGDHGHAKGPLQIHKKYWQDAVKFQPSLATGHKYNDVENFDYATQVMTAYLNRYGKQYILTNDFNALARIHNGGPEALAATRTELTNNYVKKI